MRIFQIIYVVKIRIKVMTTNRQMVRATFVLPSVALESRMMARFYSLVYAHHKDIGNARARALTNAPD